MAVYLTIQEDAEVLCDFAAQHWVNRCREVLEQQTECHIALSGGSTPKLLYRRLASEHYRDQVDWSRLHLYFGDERCVPHDHVDSNYLMARQALLDSVPLLPDHIHPLPYHSDAHDAAVAYQKILQDQFSSAGRYPRFDLVWLGMGDDGHTASLFPGTAALKEQERWCTEVYVEKLNSWRVSLTFPVLNNAAQVCMLISGAAKAQRLQQVLCPGDRVPDLPIMSIHPAGDLYWLVDAAAAASLPEDCVAALDVLP